MNRPYDFPPGTLTIRKTDILAWLKMNEVRMCNLDLEKPSSVDAFRVYIPLHLSRVDRVNQTGTTTCVFALISELFDDKFKLEFLESYPSNEDKYRLAATERRWRPL